ncbi:MAG: DinB family protein [Gemmatimonadaceae bacterium]
MATVMLASASRGGAQIAPTGPGFRAEYVAELRVAEDHLVRLAEAIPATKYSWRPAQGARSISEVLLHVAGSHFNMPRVLGVAPREGMVGADYDKSTTDKPTIVAALKASFAFMRQGIETLTDADAEKTVPWFGATNTYRGVLYFMARHTGEHTGQVIAYARMIGVVPPWSERD